MKLNNGYNKIKTDATLRETVSHGSEEYPFSYYMEDIWLFDFHCVDWHWHSETEFVYVEKGTAEFLIGSGRYALSAGSGIFINARVIHRFEAEESAVIPNIVFSPSLLSSEESLIYRKYIQPLLDSSIEYLIFSRDTPWQSDVLDTLLSVFAVQETEDAHDISDISEIKTAELLLRLWGIIYENVKIPENTSEAKASAHTRAQLQIMMQYIHKNFSEHISLDDIAKTAALSKSGVLNIFRKYLHTSPISYLVSYRLKRAARLLVTTDNGISLIARDTGFENVGYFCRKFKELFEMTPNEYRKNNLKI